MFISCSAERKILQIPENGSAVIAGSWTPEREDGLGPALLEWKEGKVSSLQPFNSSNILPEDVYTWDSYILMPGFLDAHVHLALDSIDFYKCLENWKEPSLIEDNLQEFLHRYLEMGIVAIRDGGDLPGFSWLAKNRVKEQEWLGPKVISVHEAIARRGMYGRFLGRGVESIHDWSEKETDFFAQGVDQLKIIVTGIIRFDQYGVVGPTQWTVEELEELVESAHRRGIPVMAHASGEEGITRAIEAGVDSIEHGYYMTTRQIEQMRAKNMAWIPTVAPIGNILKFPSDRYSTQEVDTLKRILESHLARIYEAYRLKVRLGVGTDAGAYQVPHAEGFHDEIVWMSKAGIPRPSVYQMATQENARILKLSEYGKLDIGSSLDQLQLVNIQEIDNISKEFSHSF